MSGTTTQSSVSAGANAQSIADMDGNVVAVIGYLIPILGVAFLLLDDNDFVRYHGLHAFLYGLVAGVVAPVSFLVGTGVGLASGQLLGGLIALFLTVVLPLTLAVLPLYFIYNAYTGGTYAVFGLRQIVEAVI